MEPLVLNWFYGFFVVDFPIIPHKLLLKVRIQSSVYLIELDHRNDVFSNSLATLTAVGGFYWRPWVDPLGGVIISLLIMYTWFETGLGTFDLSFPKLMV